MFSFEQFLIVNSRNYPNRLAIVSRQRTLTYSELNRESTCIANALKKRGVIKGDVVAFLLNNSVEWSVVWYACQKLGAVVLPLHGRLRADELIRQMSLVDCSVLIYGNNFAKQVTEIRKNYNTLRFTVCVGEHDESDALTMDSLYEDPNFGEIDVFINNDDPALILFTSGTTGYSKGIMRTQGMLVLHAITLALGNDNTQLPEVMLTTSPLYHTGGLLCLFKMAILGSTLILLDRIDPVEILEMIESYHVTQIMMLPSITYERLYKCYDWRMRDLTSVKEVCISAGKSTYEYALHIFEIFSNCHLRPSWGATETCSVTGMQLSREDLEKDPKIIGVVGKVNAFTEVRIVDKEGNDVQPGSVGEALVRSPMVFSGYLGDPEISENIFTSDGWFKTDDIMKMDPDTDNFYFIDRKSDVIKTGGENVFALEIERAIQEHPSIYECAVVGVPDDTFGEGIAAAVVLKHDRSITKDEFINFCKNQLPSFKKPRYIAIMDSLPINSVGKVQKTVLRDRADELFVSLY